MTPEQLRELLLSENKTWFTLKEVSKISNTSLDEVQKLMAKSDLFVRSSEQNEEGDERYATRQDFTMKESFTRKMIGAFKNRID